VIRFKLLGFPITIEPFFWVVIALLGGAFRANTPQPAEVMPMIDVGKGFGELPAIELIGYYIENPPAPPTAGAAAAPEIKFGGC